MFDGPNHRSRVERRKPGTVDRFELVDGPSAAESDDDSSGTDLIDRGEGGGEQKGRVPGCHEDVGADRDAVGSVRRLDIPTKGQAAHRIIPASDKRSSRITFGRDRDLMVIVV